MVPHFDSRHSQPGAAQPGRRRQDHCSKPCSQRAARSTVPECRERRYRQRFDPLPKSRWGILINASVTHLEWAGHWLNLIDTPGTPDFFRSRTGRPARGGHGHGGHQRAVRHRTGRPGQWMRRPAPHDRGQQDRQRHRGSRCPYGQDRRGIRRRMPADQPAGMIAPASSTVSSPDHAVQPPRSPRSPRRMTRIVDQVVEVDEALMALYLEQGQSLDPDQYPRPIRAGPCVKAISSPFASSRPQRRGLAALAADADSGRLARPHRGQPPEFLGERVRRPRR